MSSAPYDAFHAYIYGTSIWYIIRAGARIIQPNVVFRWFENSPTRHPTALELYNIRTDALGLALLAILTLFLSGVQVPGMTSTRPVSKAATSSTSSSTWQRAALIAIAGTVVHHVGTAVLAYGQWADSATTTGAMLLGWVYSGAIAVLGCYAYYEVSSAQQGKGQGKLQ